jgi:hypothetical protein
VDPQFKRQPQRLLHEGFGLGLAAPILAGDGERTV